MHVIHIILYLFVPLTWYACCSIGIYIYILPGLSVAFIYVHEEYLFDIQEMPSTGASINSHCLLFTGFGLRLMITSA